MTAQIGQPPSNERVIDLFGRLLRLVSAMLVAMASAVAAACGDSGRQQHGSSNLLLVTVDTLRADHLDAYGYPRRAAPAVAELAKAGVQFTEAVSQAPWTLPRRTSVHSSLYLLSQHGVIEAETALPGTADTLAEYLKATGYHTMAVTWHDFVDRKHGVARGFDVFVEYNKGGRRGHVRDADARGATTPGERP